MSIEKKSLISNLKATKKANIVKEEFGQVGSANAGLKSPARRNPGRHTMGKANLGKANLGKANLGKANLGKANLGKANLGKLIWAKLTWGNLLRPEFSRTYTQTSVTLGDHDKRRAATWQPFSFLPNFATEKLASALPCQTRETSLLSVDSS